MRHLIILTALSAVTLFAAEEQLFVHRAQMGADIGRVVLSGDQLLFVDATAPERSFSIPRANVRSLYMTNKLLSLQLEAGSIQLTDPASASMVTSWTGLPLNMANRMMTPRPGVTEFSIRHDYDTWRLLVGDRGLTIEALSNDDTSRGWSYSEVKEFKREGKRQLKINTYGGEEFKFGLIDQEMSKKVYNMIADRMVSASRPQ